MGRLRWTRHARERLGQMPGISEADVYRTVVHAEQTYQQQDRGPGRTVHQLGDLAVVVADDGAIITILYRDRDDWERPG